MLWSAVAAFVLALAALLSLLLRRRQGTPPEVAAPTPPSRDYAMRAESLASFLSRPNELPEGWVERVEGSVASTGLGAEVASAVGRLVWDRTAFSLGLGELVVPDPHASADPSAVVDLGEVEAPANGRGSLRTRRRLANLPEAEPGMMDAVPQVKPWSARGGYADVDWRTLDLPEPIPDAFVR